MSDEEIICGFAEPVPGFRGIDYPYSVGGFWVREIDKPKEPAPLTLDRLHEVEERLTDQQWQYYCVLMFQSCCREARTTNPIEDELTKNRKALLHASAPQKIAALAKVLREASRG